MTHIICKNTWSQQEKKHSHVSRCFIKGTTRAFSNTTSSGDNHLLSVGVVLEKCPGGPLKSLSHADTHTRHRGTHSNVRPRHIHVFMMCLKFLLCRFPSDTVAWGHEEGLKWSSHIVRQPTQMGSKVHVSLSFAYSFNQYVISIRWLNPHTDMQKTRVWYEKFDVVRADPAYSYEGLEPTRTPQRLKSSPYGKEKCQLKTVVGVRADFFSQLDEG